MNLNSLDRDWVLGDQPMTPKQTVHHAIVVIARRKYPGQSTSNTSSNASFPFSSSLQFSQVQRVMKLIGFWMWLEHFGGGVKYPRTTSKTYQRENEREITIDIESIDIHDAPSFKQHVESIGNRRLRISFSTNNLDVPLQNKRTAFRQNVRK